MSAAIAEVVRRKVEAEKAQADALYLSWVRRCAGDGPEPDADEVAQYLLDWALDADEFQADVAAQAERFAAAKLVKAAPAAQAKLDQLESEHREELAAFEKLSVAHAAKCKRLYETKEALRIQLGQVEKAKALLRTNPFADALQAKLDATRKQLLEAEQRRDDARRNVHDLSEQAAARPGLFESAARFAKQYAESVLPARREELASAESKLQALRAEAAALEAEIAAP